jgi:hypothetical protein
MITIKSMDAAIQKAIKRAEWYEQNFHWANDFQKRKNKQFWSVLQKFNRKHNLSIEQWNDLVSRVQEQFK